MSGMQRGQTTVCVCVTMCMKAWGGGGEKKASALLSLYYMCTSVSWQAIHQQAVCVSERYLEQQSECHTHASIYLMARYDVESRWPEIQNLEVSSRAQRDILSELCAVKHCAASDCISLLLLLFLF